MAIVSSNWGAIRGKVGDMVFRQHRGHTICYLYTPPRKSYKPTRRQQLTRMEFGLMVRYATFHRLTIAKCFQKNERLHQRDNFLKLNNKALREAVAELAERQLEGEYITIQEIETAVSSYAKEHPTQIVIARLKGYEPVYLAGDWPEVIELREKKKYPTEVRQILPDGSERIILLSSGNQGDVVGCDGFDKRRPKASIEDNRVEKDVTKIQWLPHFDEGHRVRAHDVDIECVGKS